MKTLLSVLVFCASISALAQIELGQPTYGGNGCPQGTASVVLSDDRQTMSVLFDQFSAEAGSTTDRRVDRASCNLRVPVKVPVGYSVSIIHADYRGFVAIPGNGAYATFNSEFFFAGQARGPKMTKKFVGPKSDDYLISSEIAALVWSPCGQDTILAINTSATSMSNSAMQQTMMTVDSLDMTSERAGMIYSFNVRRCQ